MITINDLLPFLKIIQIIVVLILTIASTRIVTYILNHIKRLDKNVTLIYALRDLIRYIIYIMAALIIFAIVGIDLKGIFVSIGIVGIAVSFAAKDIISNFMSGFFLIADKTLEVGDMMQINTLKGKVKKIGLRNTTIESESGDTITIPNSTLSTTPYARFKDYEQEKVTIPITLPLSIDIEEFEKEILKIIDENKNIMKNPKATVESNGISKDGSLLTVQFWVKTFNKKEDYNFIITNHIRNIINEKLGDDN